MKMECPNGEIINLISRGIEEVYIYGDAYKRTVYCIPNEWRFYIKVDGKFIRVWHKSSSFSTTPDTEYINTAWYEFDTYTYRGCQIKVRRSSGECFVPLTNGEYRRCGDRIKAEWLVDYNLRKVEVKIG